MPEGHQTHYFARQHSDQFAEQSLQVTSPQGRFRSDSRKVTRRVLEKVDALGKHLFYCFEGDAIVHVHLGRYGKFRRLPSPPPPPVGQVRMRMKGQRATLDLTGPTTCRVIDSDTRREVESRLGPDPLAGGSKSTVWKSFQSSNKPIGALLLDQAIVAGVGNIFRAEVLFETGLNPLVPGSEMTRSDFDAMWKCLNKMMKVGLKHGKIIAVTAREAGMPLAKIAGKDRFRVYAKERCPRCNQRIQAMTVAARKLYVCPGCQHC